MTKLTLAEAKRIVLECSDCNGRGHSFVWQGKFTRCIKCNGKGYISLAHRIQKEKDK